jgi:hypothetical protein
MITAFEEQAHLRTDTPKRRHAASGFKSQFYAGMILQVLPHSGQMMYEWNTDGLQVVSGSDAR